MITFKHKGNFNKTEKFLKRAKAGEFYKSLDKYAQKGVQALQAATPVDTGKTADSWDYEIEITKESATITWTNSNVNDGVNIAVLIQYGHGTRNGGYVKGRDFINPAMQPVFDEIVDKVWKEVTQ